MKLRSVIIIAIASLFAACGSGADSPTQVAEKYLIALDKMDFDAAKKLSTERTAQMLDMLGPMMKMMGDEVKQNAGFKITGEKIEGDKATVTYRTDGKDADESLALVKKDGKWLVDSGKEDSMGGEGITDAMLDDLTAGMDSLQAGFGDSLLEPAMDTQEDLQ